LVSKHEVTICSRMIRLIREKEEGIHRWDLIDEVHISIGTYQKMKGYILHKYAETVKYDSFTQMWIPLTIPGSNFPTQQETLDKMKKIGKEEKEKGK